MRIDLHCHVVGDGHSFEQADKNIFFNPDDNPHLMAKFVANLVKTNLSKLHPGLVEGDTVNTDVYFDLLADLLMESTELDCIVLLAMDAVYDAGKQKPDIRKTDLYITNRFLHERILIENKKLATNPRNTTGKKFLLGASVNPNRPDWQRELEYVINETDAVLLKWIPSAQHIHLGSPKLKPFYRKLADSGLPLLCHVGPEYTFAEGLKNGRLDEFSLLRNPLDQGVKVIAAHCALPLISPVDTILTGSDQLFYTVEQFADFMEEYNHRGETRLWVDNSALLLPFRLFLISEVLEYIKPEWILHGSDFPIPIDEAESLSTLIRNLFANGSMIPPTHNISNPFDRDVKLKKACGFKSSTLTNAVNVLRLGI